MASSSHTSSAQPRSRQPAKTPTEIRGSLNPHMRIATPSEDRLVAMLDEMEANGRDRKRKLVPICSLAFLFDEQQAIPASELCPHSLTQRDWLDYVQYLSGCGLLDAYSDNNNRTCVGFGKPVNPPKAYKHFEDSGLRDRIMWWIFDRDLFGRIFQHAVSVVDGHEKLGGLNEFPRYTTLTRLMKVHTDLANRGEEEDPPKWFDPSVTDEFGEMLEHMANDLEGQHAAQLRDFVSNTLRPNGSRIPIQE